MEKALSRGVGRLGTEQQHPLGRVFDANRYEVQHLESLPSLEIKSSHPPPTLPMAHLASEGFLSFCFKERRGLKGILLQKMKSKISIQIYSEVYCMVVLSHLGRQNVLVKK